jgi:hypothetical protein
VEPFREFYISSIVPQLRKIEDERRTIEKRLYRIAIIYILILTVIAGFLFNMTHNFKVVYIFFGLPIPFTIFTNDLIKKYSKKYKNTVIKNLFLSYFDDYEIVTERRSQLFKIKDSGFISSKWKIKIDEEDFITVKFKGTQIGIQEVRLKQGNKVFFKGILCSLDLKHKLNQDFILFDSDKINYPKHLPLDNYKTININDIIVMYQDSFDPELSSPYIEFVNNNHVSLSIQNDKIHCLFPSDRFIIDDKLEMFEPIVITKFNSNDTYRFIRNEYLMISKISRLLLKLEEINIP